MAVKARVTAEDLARLEEPERSYELVNGELVEMPRPKLAHGYLAAKVSYWLWEHVGRHGGGAVFSNDAGFILRLPYDAERVRGPDVAFIAAQRLAGGPLRETYFEGAPDLAVEILSQSESAND